MGRGARLTYIVGGFGQGNYGLELSSLEQEKLARVSVEIDPPTPADQAATDLQNAEDALANADLVRNRAKSAIAGLDATKSYDDALVLATKLGNTPLTRLILTQKARFFIFRQSKFADARALLERAVALPSAGDVAQQGAPLAWKTLSTVRYDLGEYLSAIQAGMTSLHLYRDTGDLYWQGIVLGNLSSVYAELGQADEALSTAKEALHDAEQEHDAAGVVYCLAQVADLYSQQGDLDGALHTFHEGLDWVGHIDYAPLVEAEIQKDLGLFYAQIGECGPGHTSTQPFPRARRQAERSRLARSPWDAGQGVVAAIRESCATPSRGTLPQLTRPARAGLKHEESALLLKRASVQPLAEAPHRSQSRHRSWQPCSPFNSPLCRSRSKLPSPRETRSFPPTRKPRRTPAGHALQLAELTGEREQQSVALAGLARAQQGEGRLEEATTFDRSRALKILETSRGNLGSAASCR